MPKTDVNSVFSPPTMTSTPPIAPLCIVEQVIKEDDEAEVVDFKSKSNSPPSAAEDSGASGESNETITPPSSPIPATMAAAPMKKNGGIMPASKRLHSRSESVPVNNLPTQPLAIKKKAVARGSLARSNSTATTTSTLLRRRSSLMPTTAPVSATKEVKDVKMPSSTVKVGGARRVPLTADAPLLSSKAKQEICNTTAKPATVSKGPQRPPISGTAPSIEPRVAPRNPTARILSTSAPKPRPLSLQLPSAFSVTATVPSSAVKNRSAIVAPSASVAGASKLPQPQSRSRIPGPSTRSVSGLRKAT